MAQRQSRRLCRASEEITYTRSWSASLPLGEWGFFLPFPYVRPRINMGVHPRPLVSTHYVSRGHVQLWAPTNRVVSHIPDWASTCVQVAWSPEKVGFHYPRSGHPQYGQCRVATCNYGCPSFGVGFQSSAASDVHAQGLGIRFWRHLGRPLT